MDNLSQQADELEVLQSIFDDQWVFNQRTNSYTMKIAKDLELEITLKPDYPSTNPPVYDLYAPNLSKSQKDRVKREFRDLYKMHGGSPIIFQWIEKLKEIAYDNHVEPSASGSGSNSSSEGEEQEENGEEIYNFKKLSLYPKNEKKKKVSVPATLEIIHGPTITDRKSTFQGHVCKISKPEDIKQLLNTLYENKKIAQAKHNILAYRLINDKNVLLQDCDDDGEAHAGGRLLHLLDILDLKNVAVVVTRWYGGIHLGPDRFKHINNAARQALIDAGFIR